ncbi:MAG: DUF5049 domain-containing protein [Clostridiales bacterium]|uniref:DUF5049 domain-containing protein n=1 Tax=Zhenhengia sp. TaxID=2944208 RepID=UPI00290DEBB8|nr:DUF5049 domain-containing protein [Clostridiales bacterium]
MISDIVVEQILLIRDTGKYNMFDIPNIQVEAYVRGYYELVIFLEDNLKDYTEFIMTGKR